jgi:drug/metabolite transporter (DMT)-like permease
MARMRAIGWLCAFMLLLVWVSFHLVSRLGLQSALTPWDLGALRYLGALGAGLVVLAVLAARRPGGLMAAWPRVPPARLLPVLALAAFGFPLFAYAGYRLAPAAHGATVMAAGLPVVAALFGAALGQTRIGPGRAASLAVVVAGSVLLGVATSGVWEGAWRGDLLFFAAVSCWAGFTVLVQRWRLAALDTTLAIALFAAPIFLPIWWLALPSTLDQANGAAMAFQAFFQGALAAVGAGFLYTQCVRLLGPQATTMIGTAVPGLAALLAWALLGEAVPPLGLAAIALVSVGMVAGIRAR